MTSLLQILQPLVDHLGNTKTTTKFSLRKELSPTDRAALLKLRDDIRTVKRDIAISPIIVRKILESSESMTNKLAISTNNASSLSLQNIDLVSGLNQSPSIRTDYHQTCAQDCPCKCHRLLVPRDPEVLLEILGALSMIRIGSFPHEHTKCKCAFSTLTTTLVYRFPSWLRSRISYLQMRQQYGGYSIQRCSARIIPSNSLSFICVVTGDIEALRRLFRSEAASPFDSDINGNTLLHVIYMCTGRLFDANVSRWLFARIKPRPANSCWKLERILRC